MTVQELIQLVNDKFLFEPATEAVLKHAEHFATQVARDNWPEVHSVTAELNVHDRSIALNFAFYTEQDYIWWKLKNG